MRHRLIAILLIHAISLGMLFPGLSGVAKADTSDDVLYYGDFKEKWLSISNNDQYIVSIFNKVDEMWDNPSFNFFVFEDNLGNTVFISFQYTFGDGFYGYGWHGMSTLKAYPSGNSYFKIYGFFQYNVDHFNNIYTYNSDITWANRNFALDLANHDTPSWYFISDYDIDAGLHLYSLRNLVAAGDTGWNFTANILEGSAPPEYIEFNVVTFYLGERLYFSFKEQDVFRDMEPDKMDYMLGVFHDNSDNSELYTWEDVILLPGAVNFTNVNWSNVSPAGIYAIDITNKDWIVIDMANLIEFDGELNPSFAGYAINTPYRIGDENPEPGSNGTPDSYTEVYNNWNTYITNYPNSPIVPQDLVPQFYNTKAASCKPCEVAPPSSLWNARHEVTTFGQDIFEYHFPLVSNPAYNYELFDVCVLSRQGIIGDVLQLDYTLYWWYSDSSTPKSAKIQDVNFDILMEMFDIIIVVDDPDYVLIESLPDGDVVYTGDYEYGFTYSPDAFTHGHVLYGFAFITEKAVQKQLLFNFNDGIRKTYDLMEQYIDKRSAWDNSFLDWTLTLFNQYQTIYGKLDDIYNLLFNWDSIFKSISDKLDTLISNTDNSNPDPWYLSLWNFISQFSPSNSDFSSGLDEITTTFDDIPLLPEPSAAPTLPLIGG